MEELLLPKEFTNVPNLQKLVLVTGATGSGKSTTLASMMEQINSQYAKHIITIEDLLSIFFRTREQL